MCRMSSGQRLGACLVVVTGLGLVAAGRSEGSEPANAAVDESPPLEAGAGDDALPASLRELREVLAARIDAVLDATVRVREAGLDGTARSGSGVVVSSDGLVLTAAHVVDDPERYEVVGSDGVVHAARVVARDTDRDLAVVDASGSFEAFLPITAEPSAPSAWLVCAGYSGRVPGDARATASVGVVVDDDYRWSPRAERPLRRGRHARARVYDQMLRTGCGSAAGMSGGPIVRLDGSVTGVHVGSGGIVSPVAAAGFLAALQREARVVVAGRARLPVVADRPPLPVVADESGLPSKHATLASTLGDRAEGAGASVVDLQPHDRDLSARGVVVAEGRILTAAIAVEGGAPVVVLRGTEPPRTLETRVIDVRGELALLGVDGLSVPPVAGATASAALGEPIASFATGSPSLGFVTAIDRAPGTIDAEPFGRYGCRYSRARARRASPAVEIGHVLVHDSPGHVRGALVVDHAGRPVAIDVASAGSGINYAVPFADALRRFAL